MRLASHTECPFRRALRFRLLGREIYPAWQLERLRSFYPRASLPSYRRRIRFPARPPLVAHALAKHPPQPQAELAAQGGEDSPRDACPFLPLRERQFQACAFAFLQSVVKSQNCYIPRSVLPHSRLMRSGSESQVFYNPSQILQAGRNALRRRNRSGAEFHVLLHHGPSRISVLNKRAKESRKIDITLSNHGENFVFDSFFESPFFAASFFQNFCVAIFNVNETQFVFVLFGFFYRVAMPVNAMPGIQTKAHVGVRSCVIKKFTFFGSFHVGGDVRMKHQIESEFVGHFFRVRDNLPHVLPLLRSQRGTVFVIHAAGKRISFG